MPRHPQHDQMKELLLPYAVGELSTGERTRVQHALDVDADLRRELEMIEAVGARIITGAVEVTPAPPELKGRVMTAIRAGSDRPPVDAAAASQPRAIGSARSARRPRWSAMPAFAGGLAAACLVLAVVAFDLGRELDAAERRAERLERAVDERGEEPAGLEGAEPFAVSTSGNFESAQGSLIRISDGKWLLAVRDVPSPGVGRSWQVWTASSSGIVRNVAQWSSGGTQLVVLDNADIVQVMVSFESTTRPAPSPTLPPVADVKV